MVISIGSPGATIDLVGTPATVGMQAEGATAMEATAIPEGSRLIRVSSADDARGVRLPSATAGMTITVLRSDSTNRFRIYPADGGQINGGLANAAIEIPTATQIVRCTALADTRWTCSRVDEDGGSAVSNNVDVTGNQAVGGDQTVAGTLGVNGAATFANDVTTEGDQTVKGAFTVDDNATFKKNAAVDGTMTVNGAAAFRDTVNVTGKATLNGAVDMKSKLDVAGDLSVIGDAAFDKTVAVQGNFAVKDRFSVNAATGNLTARNASLTDLAIAGTANVDGDLRSKAPLT